MTSNPQTPRSSVYTGDGSTVTFAFAFYIAATSELVVTLADANGVETVQVLDTDYTATGTETEAGGTITMTTAPAATETLVITRSTPNSQQVDLKNLGSLVPDTIEAALDRLQRQVQDLQMQVDRAVSLRDSTDAVSGELPVPSALSPIGWNNAGDGLANLTLVPDATVTFTLPGSSTDNAIMRFDGTDGTQFQNSGITIDDSNAFGTSSAWSVSISSTVRWQISTAGKAVLGSGTPAIALDIEGTDALGIPAGTTGQRPGTPAAGHFRWNTTTTVAELYDGSSWGTVSTADAATAANIRAGAADVYITPAIIESAVEEVTLTDAATIAVDWSTFVNGIVTLGDNRALGAPTNAEPGTTRIIRVVQDGTGSRTLSFNAVFKFPGGVAPTMSTGANEKDTLYIYCETTTLFHVTYQLDFS